MFRCVRLFAVVTVLLCAAGAARAADIPIIGLKLIVVDNTVLAGKAKAVFVAKDPNITKGTGTDPAQISATLDIAYNSVTGTFTMPQGGNWLVNSANVGKYVNKTAPTGGATKVSVIKPTSLVKVVGKSLGDTPLNISSWPMGNVYVVDTIVNGGDTTRLCTQFAACAYKLIAGDTGYKLVCKGISSGDPGCTAATPSTTSTSLAPTTSTSLATTTTTSTSTTTVTTAPPIVGGVTQIVFFAIPGTPSPSGGVLGNRATTSATCTATKPGNISCTNGIQALLSYSGGDTIAAMPANHGVSSVLPVVGPTGILIGNDWADLLDDSIINSMSSAGVQNSGRFWTGSDSAGGLSATYGNCDDWTSNAHTATLGQSASSTGLWLYNSGSDPNCVTSRPLICVCY